MLRKISPKAIIFSLVIIFSLCANIFSQEDAAIPIAEQETAVSAGASIEAPEDSALQKEEPVKDPNLGIDDKSSADKVNIRFDDADIRDVVKVLAEKAKMNIIVGDDVKAKVTLKLDDVLWESALDLVLRTYNLTYKKEDNLLRIMSLTRSEEEEKKVPMTTKILTLNFAQAADIQGSLAKMLSSRGSIEVNARTNSLIITDIPDKVRVVEETAKQLDSPTPQVLIEVLVLDVKLTDDDELGIDWTALQTVTRPDMTTAGTKTLELSQPMSALTSPSFQVALAKRQGSFDLDATIAAWIQNSKAKVLANPKILTLDNQEARIEIVSRIPYVESTQSSEGGSTSGTAYVDVGTHLNVTAHVTNDGQVSMRLNPQQDIQGITETTTGAPIIDTRQAETNVLVKDGETAIIGGLRRVDTNVDITKVPILGDIPLLGKVFQKKDIRKVDTELVIFVTPHIVRNMKLNVEERQRYETNIPLPQKPFDNSAAMNFKRGFSLRPPQETEKVK